MDVLVEKIVLKKISEIGLRTRTRRKELGLTLFNLAVDSECSLSVISDLERGVACGMTVLTLMKIATALRMSSDELFCDE